MHRISIVQYVLSIPWPSVCRLSTGIVPKQQMNRPRWFWHRGYHWLIIRWLIREFTCLKNKGTCFRNLVPKSELSQFRVFFCQGTSTVTNIVGLVQLFSRLSHCALVVVYNTLAAMQSITQFVCDGWDLLFLLIIWSLVVSASVVVCWLSGKTPVWNNTMYTVLTVQLNARCVM